jgi:hypothetical protein
VEIQAFSFAGLHAAFEAYNPVRLARWPAHTRLAHETLSWGIFDQFFPSLNVGRSLAGLKQ